MRERTWCLVGLHTVWCRLALEGIRMPAESESEADEAEENKEAVEDNEGMDDEVPEQVLALCATVRQVIEGTTLPRGGADMFHEGWC